MSAQVAAELGKPHNKKRRRYKHTGWAALMLLPNVVGFLMFMLIPMIAALVLSFYDYDLLRPPRFVGLANYREMLTDSILHVTLRNTFVYTLIVVPFGMALSLVLAVLVDRKIIGMRFYRAAYFLPTITSMVAVAVVWQWIYNPEFGLLNFILGIFGMAPRQWLTSSDTSLVSIAIVAVWHGLGFNMMLFLAGLQGIDSSLYESSDLDGAGPLKQLFYITIPMLRPTTMFVFIMSIIGSFQAFATVHLMTGGGPGRSSSLIVHYLYQNAFVFFRMGYASAIAYLLFFIILIVTAFNMRMNKTLREIF